MTSLNIQQSSENRDEDTNVMYFLRYVILPHLLTDCVFLSWNFENGDFMSAYGSILITQVLFLQDVPKDKGKSWPYSIILNIFLSILGGTIRTIFLFTRPLCLSLEESKEVYGENFDEVSCKEIKHISKIYVIISTACVSTLYIFLLFMRKRIQKIVKSYSSFYYLIHDFLNMDDAFPRDKH